MLTHTYKPNRAERCLHEFFDQGAKERELGLPISPQCNAESTSMPSSQLGFIKVIVLPLYEALGMLLPEVQKTCVSQLSANLSYWQAEADKLKSKDDKKAAIARRNSLIIKRVESSGDSRSSSHSRISMEHLEHGRVKFLGRVGKAKSSKVMDCFPKQTSTARCFSMQLILKQVDV